MRVKLTVNRGSNAGKAFDVNVPQFVIGRAKGCQLRPQSDAISRQHCVICVTEESVTIRDLGSRNGTIVNEEKIEGTYTFSDGDELRVGPLHLTVNLLADAKTEKTKQSDSETIVASTDETQAVKPAKETKPAAEPMPTRVISAAKKGPKDISDSGDIGDWLDDEDTDTKSINNAETRRFRLDESERIEIQKAAEEVDEKAVKAADKEKKKKKEPGKLPPRKDDTTENSRDAAEATLRKMFNRGL